MDQNACLRQQSKHVEFQDVYYTVKERKNFIKVTGSREILCGVSGSFRNGQLSAIMGPSGAGKSSLLNAISGYRTSGVTGHIKLKRQESCYITQEDHHQTLLTVDELMNLSCNLKLRIGQRKKHELITEILENLSLQNRRQQTANHLSGGERKRLSIALELVANPNVFFLDEPTSGLDEVTAAQCIRLLGQLAKQGKCVICTIHQPSATIFNYFDNIFVLAKGQCVYQGSPGAVIPFLRHVQLECPKYYSPSDYIIELCDSDDNNLIPLLSHITDNGKLIYVPVTNLEDQSQPLQLDDNNMHNLKEFHQAITTLFMEKTPKRSPWSSCFFSTGAAASTDGSLIGGASALYEHMKAFSKRVYTERQETSAFHQFYVLCSVMLLRITRARIALGIQFFHHLLCGLFFGLIFFRLGNKGERMFDHLKFCMGTVLMIVYTQVMVPILSFPAEVKIVKKETFNRWYSLTPYYLALNIARLPFQLALNVIFMSIVYIMAGLPEDWFRFGLFIAVGQLVSIVAEGMGLAIGATFSITNGCAVGPMTIAPLTGLAIYGFDFAAQISVAMNLLMKCSFIRVGVVSMVVTVFGFNRPELDCNDIYCHFQDPRVLLRFLQFDHVSMWHQFMLLALLMIFFRVILYISLYKRCGT